MRLRRWLSVVAMLGVLLHAAALVRHHGAMLGAHLQYQALVSDLLAFCHGGTDASSKLAADLPAVPAPSDTANGCPICFGQAPPAAVAGPVAHVPLTRIAIAVAWREAAPQEQVHHRTFTPPARGPPSLTQSV